MTNRLKYLDLILVLIITIACLTVIIKPNLINYNLRTLLLILLILFLSGYSLVSALYPRKNDLDFLERLALSFGFPLLGLVIVIVLTNLVPTIFNTLNNYQNMILKSLALLTIVLTIIAIIRRKRVSDENKFVYSRVNEVKNAIKPELYGENQSDIKDKSIPNKKIKISTGDNSKSNLKTEINRDNYPSFVTKDLVLIFLATILTMVFVINPKLNDTFVRTILGLLLILFIPGYSLIAALFPKKEDLDGIERIALSFGLSIGLSALFGLLLKYSLLNYLPYGNKLIHLTNSSYVTLALILSVFTLLMLFIAFIRRRRVPEGEKFHVNFGGFASSIKGHFKGESKTSKILSIILIISILLAICTTVYIILQPKHGETFTEFYILGPNGKASDYPTNLTVGKNGTVIIGVVNHEYQTSNYEMVVKSNNGTVMNQQNIILTNGNQTQIPYTFTASSAGYKNIEFLLYKLPDTTNVYRSLHLYVNMT